MKIKQEVGNCVVIHGTKAAIDRFSKIYSKFSLKKSNIKCIEAKVKKNDFLLLARKKRGPSLVDDEMLQKIRHVIIRSRLAGAAISRKVVITIGIGVTKANESKLLMEFSGSLELTKGSA